MNNLKREYVNWVDSIRGIAIFMIFCTHYRVSNNATYNMAADFGSKGVLLFYIISTYLAMESYSKYQRDHFERVNSIIWIMKKLTRLIPVYWLILFFSIITSSLRLNYSEVITSMFFLNAFIPERLGIINGFTMVLVPMYFFIPCVFRKINTVEKSIVFSTVVIASSYYINNFSRKIFNIGTDDIYLRQYLFMTIINWGIMSLGVVIFNIIQKYGIPNLLLIENKSIYLVLIVIAFMLLSYIKHGDIQSHSSIIIISLAFTIIILGCYISKNRLVVNKIWSFLGQYTYGIYLFHLIIILVYEKYFDNRLFIFFLAFITSTLLSVLVTQYFEKPILKYIKKLF